MPRLLMLLLSLLIASSASAVTMAWTPIGNPGNPADTQVMGCCGGSTGTTGYGSVAYSYLIGTYEVTNAQYTEFLNATAASDPFALYNANMGNPDTNGRGGITRSGSSGSYTYTAIAGRENKPVNWVSFYDALRFANWMNNGQGNGSTENGAYTITAQGISANSITRNAGATIFLTSENEWYKAAYYDASSLSYHTFPFADGFNGVSCQAPAGTTSHSANCDGAAQGDLANVGSYANSSSSYGTFDQAGNLIEWNEAIDGAARAWRDGGYFIGGSGNLAATRRNTVGPTFEGNAVGFRLAMIPEPGTGLLVVAGLLALAGRRRARA